VAVKAGQLVLCTLCGAACGPSAACAGMTHWQAQLSAEFFLIFWHLFSLDGLWLCFTACRRTRVCSLRCHSTSPASTTPRSGEPSSCRQVGDAGMMLACK
jgi:hypothetical protein